MTCKEKIRLFNDVSLRLPDEIRQRIIDGLPVTPVAGVEWMFVLRAQKLWADALASAFELLAVKPGFYLVPTNLPTSAKRST